MKILMKKTVLIALLALVFVACQQTDRTEEAVRQSVERMMLSNSDTIFTAEMRAIQKVAEGIHYDGYYFMEFDWTTGVFDACSENAGPTIVEVRPLDSIHSQVDMRYVDEGCYDIQYVLHLLREDGQWRIDDVTFETGNTLRGDCEAFCKEVNELYCSEPADEIVAFLLEEEPWEETYTDPGTIFYNNPQRIHEYAEELRNCLKLFSLNPGYTEEYGQQVEAMIERIESHCDSH